MKHKLSVPARVVGLLDTDAISALNDTNMWSNYLFTLRQGVTLLAELHTGVPQGKLSQGKYFKKLCDLGYESDLKKLLKWLAEEQLF